MSWLTAEIHTDKDGVRTIKTTHWQGPSEPWYNYIHNDCRSYPSCDVYPDECNFYKENKDE